MTKDELEIEKLVHEIRELQRRWWLPPIVQATPGVLLGICTLLAAWGSGLVDVRRENIAVQNERLEIRRAQLHADTERLQADAVVLRKEKQTAIDEVQKVNEELLNARLQISANEAERKAIKRLRQSSIARVSFVNWVVDDSEGYLLTINGTILAEAKRVKNLLPDLPIETQFQNVHEILNEAKAFRSLHQLKIESVKLVDEDLKHVGDLTNLQSLVLEDNQLGNEAMKAFPELPNLTSLYFVKQQFREAEGLRRLHKLVDVGIDDVPGGEDVLRGLLGSRMSLKYITLTKSACGDKEAAVLADFPHLALVSVDGEEIESSAVELLLKHPSLKVWIRAPHTQWMRTMRKQYGEHRIVLENDRM